MEPYIKTCKSKRWFIVIAAFIATIMNMGLLLSHGALFAPIAEKYGTNRSSTALVYSLASGAGAFAVIVGALIAMYGLWKITLVGTILTIVGFGGGFFATSIVHLYIFVSIFAGTGMVSICMCDMVAIARVTDERTKAAALAINSSFIGLGGAVFPHLFNYLTLLYGLNGVYLIIAGMCCNNMVLVLLLFDLPITSESSTNECATHSPDVDVTNGVQCTQKAKLLIQSSIQRIKAKVLKILSVQYVLVLIASTPVMSLLDGYVAVYVDMYTSMAFSEEQGFLSMSLYQIGSIVAGLLAGLLRHIKALNPIAVGIVYSLVGCVGLVLLNFSISIWMAYAGSFILGMMDGGIFTSIGLIVSDLVSEEQYGIAYGLIITAFTCMSAATGPLFGALRDASQSYVSVFLLMGIVQISTAVLYLTALVVQRRSKSTSSMQQRSTSRNSIAGADNPSFTLDAPYIGRRPSFVH